MTGCNGDILKIRKMTGAKQQLALQIGEKMPKTLFEMSKTSFVTQQLFHVVHESKFKHHDFFFLFLFGPNSSPWALAVIVREEKQSKTEHVDNFVTA